jgi:hypothetical protein
VPCAGIFGTRCRCLRLRRPVPLGASSVTVFKVATLPYFHIADEPLRRQRKTVSGWTMTRLLRQSDHQRDSKIQNRRSKRRKQGRRVRLRFSTTI